MNQVFSGAGLLLLVGDSNIKSGGVSGDLSSLFKKPVGSWDCPTCMIQNKAPVTKCVACNTSKPSSTTTSTTKSSPTVRWYTLTGDSVMLGLQ